MELIALFFLRLFEKIEKIFFKILGGKSNERIFILLPFYKENEKSQKRNV